MVQSHPDPGNSSLYVQLELAPMQFVIVQCFFKSVTESAKVMSAGALHRRRMPTTMS